MVATARTSVDRRSSLRSVPERSEPRLSYFPQGACRDLFFCLDPEVLIEGPAGTGKSLACLKRLDRNAVKYPGCRQLILRKTRESLTQSALVTFERHVIIPGGRVRFHTTLQSYLYPNGSAIVVGGLDKDTKVMSAEYDAVYVQEATELAEPEWETLTTRLRHGVIPHQQMIADCNPSSPNHWLNKRCNAGKTTRIVGTHEDNPVLWDAREQRWTDEGVAYMARLEALTGHRYQRLRLGKWVAAEGLVYPGFRPEQIQTVDCEGWGTVMGLDLGTRNPTAMHVYRHAGDRIHVESEFYRTGLGSEEIETEAEARYHAAKAEWIVVDPSAAGLIVTLEKKGLKVKKAINDILVGISRVTSALPDLTVDPSCVNMIAEFESYAYATGQKTERDVPVKANDHALDELRYVCMELVDPPSSWADVDPAYLASFLRA
jgi:PBSX family phage terminase large subunit